MLNNQKSQSLIRAYIIIILASLFYFYEFSVQFSSSVLTTELMQTFSLNAASLSTLVALFYYAYVIMQIPSGLLCDRFGAHRVLTITIFICAFGTLIFATTDQLWLTGIARFMMGFGGAFAFVGVLILAANWFPARYFAFIAGVVQFLGSIGALVGEGPLSIATAHLGWRSALMGLAMIGIVIALLVWFIVRDRPQGMPEPKVHKFGAGELHRLRLVLRRRQTWMIGIYSFAIWGPITVFPALWGVAYIRTLYHVNTVHAASIVELLWLGVAVGSPLIGWWSEKIGRRNVPLIISAVVGLISTLFILWVPMSILYMKIMMIIFGLSASGQALAFGVVKDNNSSETMGTAVGFNNLCVVAGGMFILPFVGLLIKWGWNGRMAHHIPIYTLIEYRDAMYVLPICFIIALIMGFLYIKETYCKSQL